MEYLIEARGPAGPTRVIDPHTNEVLIFPSRLEAREHADSIEAAIPSKYLPLVIVAAGNGDE